jgi:hypothetical protein
MCRRHAFQQLAPLLAALTVAGGAARAQSPSVTIPPNLIVPNYERIPIGQREGIEAGAFVARTNDAAANWYNPAGLVRSEASAINSAVGYEWIRISVEGIGTTAGRSRLSTVGTLVAGVLGAPIIRSDRWRVGFSLTRPLAWRPSGVDAASAVPLGEGSEALGYAAEADLSSYIPAVAVGYAPGGRSSRVRLGAGLGFSVTGLSQSQSVTGQVVTDAGAGTATRRFTAEGNTAQALVTGGAQWDVHPRVALGARIVSPGLRLTGTSRLSYHATISEQPGFADMTLRDTEAKFVYKIPLEVDIGAALRAARGEVEVGVRYHGSVSAHDLYSSDVAGRLVRADGRIPPSVEAVPFAAARNSARSITNVVVGGHYQILSRIRVHAGFATDRSPVDDQTTSLFRKVNLYRVTTGASFTWSSLSGSLGIAYSAGSSTRRTTQDTDDGRPVETGLTVRSINLSYALS